MVERYNGKGKGKGKVMKKEPRKWNKMNFTQRQKVFFFVFHGAGLIE